MKSNIKPINSTHPLDWSKGEKLNLSMFLDIHAHSIDQGIFLFAPEE
jgi:hypothetical protein